MYAASILIRPVQPTAATSATAPTSHEPTATEVPPADSTNGPQCSHCGWRGGGHAVTIGPSMPSRPPTGHLNGLDWPRAIPRTKSAAETQNGELLIHAGGIHRKPPTGQSPTQPRLRGSSIFLAVLQSNIEKMAHRKYRTV
ncbi:hypothetical protein DFH09DRAFT_1275568 [Mycena vulgaris]|nr:hypothetical protein DFH09DRAFT_1275568 [Mycena vulgaris]